MNDARAFKDHYATLGVPPNASAREIRRARNRLLKQHHPDCNPQSDLRSKETTIAIILAAKVLLDRDARKEYDRTHRYVRGRTPDPTGKSSTPSSAAQEGVDCESCGRHNSWGRAYCIYCGAGIGDASPGIRWDEFLSDEFPSRRDRASTALHFGCGMLVGFFAFGVYGGIRMGAYLGTIESGTTLLIVTLIGAIGCGVLGAALRDDFWPGGFLLSLLLPTLFGTAVEAITLLVAAGPVSAVSSICLFAFLLVLFMMIVSKLLGRHPG